MIKKTIKFENFDGEMVEETFHFHLNKAELIELELGREGGLSAYLQRIVDAEVGAELVRELKALILLAYGEKSEDGKHFVKSQRAREAFAASEAFGELFMEIATDADKAIEFVNGMVPKNLGAQLDNMQTTPAKTTPAKKAVAKKPASKK